MFFWLVFHIYDKTTAGGTKYEFIIAVRGYNCLIKIECLHQFIDLFHTSVFNVCFEYTLCVS